MVRPISKTVSMDVTDAEIDEMMKSLRSSVSDKKALKAIERLIFIKMRRAGIEMSKAMEVSDISKPTAYEWQEDWNKHGLESIIPNYAGGAPRRLDDEQLEAVKELLGHESLSTTEIYTHTTFAELKKEYEENLERLRKRAEERKTERDTVKAEMEARADSMELATVLRTWEKDSIDRIPFFDFKLTSSATVEVDAPLTFEVVEPIDTIIMSGFHLWKQYEDSLWEEQAVPALIPDKPHEIMKWSMPVKWEPGATYKFRIDSMSVYGIYGAPNKTLEQEFKVRGLEEYANLYFSITPATGPAFVELLNTSDAVQRTAPVGSDGYAVFNNVTPGDYYARIVLDRNDNGQWDTGNFAQHLQPEEVYYYPKKISLKQNWDIEQSWNIYEVAVDMQKPEAIKKNKPEKKKWEKNDTDRIDEEEEDIYDEGPAIYTGNKYTDFQRNNRINNY